MSNAPSDPAPAARLRASDAEREEIAQIVREAVGDGRLDMAEGDERLAAVYAARFRDDLPPVVGDLPDGQARLRPGPGLGHSSAERTRGPGWAGPPWAGRGDAHRRGRAGAPRRRFGMHLGLVALVAVVLVAVWSVTGSHIFWPVFPLVFLSVGLLRHWRWAMWSRRW